MKPMVVALMKRHFAPRSVSRPELQTCQMIDTKNHDAFLHIHDSVTV